MKIAPIHRRMQKNSSKLQPFLIHTGQHYDERMSQFFFNDLELPKPDVYLGVGSGSHAEQTAKIMVEFEKNLYPRKTGSGFSGWRRQFHHGLQYCSQ